MGNQPSQESAQQADNPNNAQAKATNSLPDVEESTEKRGNAVQYKLTVQTGNAVGVGTSASVYIIIYGEKENTGVIRLPKEDKQGKKYFQQGQTDVIVVNGFDVGPMRKIRVGHDNKGWDAGWFLDKITVKNIASQHEVEFPCYRWLDKRQDDNQIMRDLLSSNAGKQQSLARYKIIVKTGDVSGAGTDANVFITLFGDKGDTGERPLPGGRECFERNRIDTFYIEADDVGALKKIRIGHDNKGLGASWFLEKVTIQNEKKGTWEFPCNKWFDKDKDDKLLVRDLYTSEEQNNFLESVYKVKVQTANIKGAGTSANVFIHLFGKQGDSGQLRLEGSSRDSFSKGKTDEFDLSMNEIGDITKIRIGHDNSGIGSDWLLDGVHIRNERTGREWTFPCGKWLSKSVGDCQFVRELYPVGGDIDIKTSVSVYRITVKTSDVRGSGTDANVFINIIGENGDTGNRPLDNASNNFERGKIDVFGIESMDLGELKKITIGHDGSGFGAGWFLEYVTIRNEKTTKEWRFPCGRWLASDEDDGKIVRDLEPSSAEVTGRVMYKVSVVTGNRRGAGTDANVYIEIYGTKGKSGVKKLDNSENNFERGQTDIFSVDSIDLGELTKIRIGHDGAGFGAGWFLEKVIIEGSKSSDAWFFNCSRWLASDEDDGLIERELPAEKEGKPVIPLTRYKVQVSTGDRRGAGTSAKVFLTIYGSQGDSGKIRLENGSGNFSRNSTDIFGVECVELGELKKIRVGHDNSGFTPGWFLDKVIISISPIVISPFVTDDSDDDKATYFLCGRWLAKDEDDGQIEREIPASTKDGQTFAPMSWYKITTVTGDRRGAGTDANVYIILYGDEGDSGKRKLEGPGNLFERAQRDTFGIECVELGPIKRIVIGHDGSGFGSGWFLDKVIVQSLSLKKEWYFLCGRWLDKGQEDGLIERELKSQDEDGIASIPLTRYQVEVTTADRPGSGTDANVYIIVFGKNGDSGQIHLDNPQNNFERGKTDVFGFESIDLGELSKLRVWHDNSGFGASWFLDKIVITNMDNKGKTYFLCGRWLSKSEDDSQISRELPASGEDGITYAPIVTYRVIVVTGNVRGAGTDANVFITIYGENGDSGKVQLTSAKNNFEKGATDTFGVQCVDLGEIKRIKIEHDGTGFGAGWFLDKVIIKSGKGNEYYFLCGRWLDKGEDDGQIYREMDASESDGQSYTPAVVYRVTTVTADRKGAGTSATPYITIYGKSTNSGQHKLEGIKNAFRKGQSDTFGIETVDLGDLTKIRIGHDNKGFTPGWFLDKVIIECEMNQEKWFFNCGKWLAKDEDDKQIERELIASKEGAEIPPLTNYKVTVVTGDRRGASTSARVSLTIYGDNGDTGSRVLEKDKAFQRNSSDEFGIECVDLGDLKKIRIGHDNGGFTPGWFLEKLTIKNESTGKEWYFLCGRWLAKDEDDCQIQREIPASDKDGQASLPMSYYQVSVVTGNRRGAGTDANVFIIIYGENGDTGKRKLEGPGNLFERSRTDIFTIESVELGPIKRILIGHDGAGIGSGWFLDKVIVKSLSLKKEWYFLCGKWLDKGEDDGKIEREIISSDEDGIATQPLVRYRVQVTTGSRRGAGTDANVFISVYGDKKSFGPFKLDNPQNNFERGKTDVFGFECEDLGNLTKIRIGHDNSGFGASWFLDKVVITNMDNNLDTFFLCGRWLSKSEEDGQIERELPASDKDGVASIPLVQYKIEVKTGDRKGAGTDANVYVFLYGDNGDSGKRILDKPGDNFERNQLDEFGIECVDLGDLKKLRVGHDNSGFGASWFLEKITVTNLSNDKKWFFLCGKWLAKDEEDGRIERELVSRGEDGVACAPMTYFRVTVVTGSRRGAGTDANVFITLFGESGDTGSRKLEGGRGTFQRGKTDVFGIEAVDIGALQKIKIGHDGSKPGAGWFLDKIIVKSESLGKEWYFLAGRWLATDEEDGKIEIELNPQSQDGQASPPLVTYRVSVLTGDRPGAGTDANVSITMYGKKGDSGPIKLESKSRDTFERNKTDIFEIECVDLGELSKIRIGHDNSKLGSAWFLEKVIITNLSNQSNSYFLCGRWLAKDEDDGQIEREIPASSEDGQASLPLSKYEISVKTGSIRGAGTDANVFIILYGENGDSGRRKLDGPGNKFEKGQTDNFVLECVELGSIFKIRIGHDGSGFGSDWFLESVTVKSESNEYKFPCNRWFSSSRDDKQLERELMLNGESGPGISNYRINVITGNIRGAGTDADVFITVVGDKGKIDRQILSNSKDNFERGKFDSFGIQTLDMGDIQNITIGHNGRGFGSAWFLDKVFIINETSGKRWIFPCSRWFSKKEDDGKIERTLFPSDGSSTTYNIKVKTGNVRGAGTDANVYIYITGDKGRSEKLELKNSLTNINKFERGCLDIFNMDSIDVGVISKIDIGHDNAGFGASWYLECVEIMNYATGDSLFFSCNKWLDKSKDDKKLERELFPSDKTGEIKDEFTEDDEENDGKSDSSSKKKDESSGQSGQQQQQKLQIDPSFTGGRLIVHVLEGRNLASKDSNGLSDPYCNLYLLDDSSNPIKKSKSKTKVIKKSLNPKWNESFQFDTNGSNTGLLIDMYDEDIVGSDEFMGQVIIPVSEFKKDQPIWVTLKPRDSKDEVSGDVCVKLSMK